MPHVEENSPKSRLFGLDSDTGELIIGKYRFYMPKNRVARIVLGLLLIFGGIFSFLPVLGVWMLPLGLLVLSQDLAFVRRWRRQLSVWWERRNAKTDGQK